MKRLYLILLALPLWAGCQEEARLDHFDDGAPAPAPVENVTYEQIPGGVVLRYDLPADKNLRYVRAEYETSSGVSRNAISSYLVDSLVLNGFGDTGTHSAKLYSVGINEKFSEPVATEFTPGLAGIHRVSKTMEEGFGGVRIGIENPDRENLAVVVYGDTVRIDGQLSGRLAYLETFYTSARSANFSLRGLKSDEYDFSVYVRDRWGYTTDTLSASLTPKFEEPIPQTRWNPAYLPGDIPQTDYYWPLQELWDGLFSRGVNIAAPYAPPGSTFTIDLGQTIIMSRLKWWHMGGYEYLYGSLKTFELYGATSAEGPWVPLGRFDWPIPSGGTAPTAEDIAFAQQGLDAELMPTEFAPEPYTPFRYLKFKKLSVYNAGNETTLISTELQIWGQIVEQP